MSEGLAEQVRKISEIERAAIDALQGAMAIGQRLIGMLVKTREYNRPGSHAQRNPSESSNLSQRTAKPFFKLNSLRCFAAAQTC